MVLYSYVRSVRKLQPLSSITNASGKYTGSVVLYNCVCSAIQLCQECQKAAATFKYYKCIR